MSLYEIRNLHIHFPTKRGMVQAVRGVSFDIHENECVALVGESGCGKSVTARSLMGLTKITGGQCLPGSEIRYQGQNILDFNEKQWRDYRGNTAALIFQDSMTALNPTMRIGKQIAECYTFHQKISSKEAMEQAIEMLRLAGIASPEDMARRYPHELSGGMRQRVMIASALACKPSLLIADEPTTALDVTIQAQILELIGQMKQREKAAVLLITHDMGVVAGLAQRIVIMYAGCVMETGTTDEIFYHAQHPYTKGLQKASPRLDKMGTGRLYTINGTPPELIDPVPGCPFADRCPDATELCRQQMPQIRQISQTHSVACHHAKEAL